MCEWKENWSEVTDSERESRDWKLNLEETRFRGRVKGQGEAKGKDIESEKLQINRGGSALSVGDDQYSLSNLVFCSLTLRDLRTIFPLQATTTYVQDLNNLRPSVKTNKYCPKQLYLTNWNQVIWLPTVITSWTAFSIGIKWNDDVAKLSSAPHVLYQVIEPRCATANVPNPNDDVRDSYVVD